MTDATTPEQPRTAAAKALLAELKVDGTWRQPKNTPRSYLKHMLALVEQEAQARPAAASPGLRAGDAYERLRDEFLQRPDPNSLDRWRKALPPDFPLYNAHGDYIGRLTELHQDADHLSCLGCGQIGTPSTFSSTTGIYLCAERCVPAIRAALASDAGRSVGALDAHEHAWGPKVGLVIAVLLA